MCVIAALSAGFSAFAGNLASRKNIWTLSDKSNGLGVIFLLHLIFFLPVGSCCWCYSRFTYVYGVVNEVPVRAGIFNRIHSSERIDEHFVITIMIMAETIYSKQIMNILTKAITGLNQKWNPISNVWKTGS